MGTRLQVTIEATDRGTALGASEAALHAVAEVELRLSTWRDDSELALFNRAPFGTTIPLSRELAAELFEARNWWMESGGAFDPGIASLVRAWDLRGPGREPSTAELGAARATAGLEHLFLGMGVARRLVDNFGIEEGGFAKGIAVRLAAAAAFAAGATCVVMDFGGQVEMSGDCGERWVEIADPDRRDHGAAWLRLRSGSVATSGNSERGVVINGVRRGHLLDPRTGWPAPDWGSVTVVASDPVAADCLSTALFVMGPRRGEAWLRGRAGIDAVFAIRDGDRTIFAATPGLEDRLEVLNGNLEFLPTAPPAIGACSTDS
jgi:thiamine biosynthesis lipoprotein